MMPYEFYDINRQVWPFFEDRCSDRVFMVVTEGYTAGHGSFYQHGQRAVKAKCPSGLLYQADIVVVVHDNEITLEKNRGRSQDGFGKILNLQDLFEYNDADTVGTPGQILINSVLDGRKKYGVDWIINSIKGAYAFRRRYLLL